MKGNWIYYQLTIPNNTINKHQTKGSTVFYGQDIKYLVMVVIFYNGAAVLYFDLLFYCTFVLVET